MPEIIYESTKDFPNFAVEVLEDLSVNKEKTLKDITMLKDCINRLNNDLGVEILMSVIQK